MYVLTGNVDIQQWGMEEVHLIAIEGNTPTVT